VANSIVIWPLGGLTPISSEFGGPRAELWIALAGPITHILQGMFWFAIYGVVALDDFSGLTDVVDVYRLRSSFQGFLACLVAQTILLNVALGTMNLFVPAYPLDGGRILVAALLLTNVKVEAVAKITGVSGFVVGFLMLILGLFLYIQDRVSYGVVLALVAAICLYSSSGLLRTIDGGVLGEHPLFEHQCYSVATDDMVDMADADPPEEEEEELELT